jgi:hypothetical protein
MGLTWPWWFPKKSTYIDYFHFLPRRRINLESDYSFDEISQEIISTEKSVQSGQFESLELKNLITLRHKEKDMLLSQFQKSLDEIFATANLFKPLSTNQSLNNEYQAMLERLYKLKNIIIHYLEE